jgi:hypothetical protein
MSVVTELMPLPDSRKSRKEDHERKQHANHCERKGHVVDAVELVVEQDPGGKREPDDESKADHVDLGMEMVEDRLVVVDKMIPCLGGFLSLGNLHVSNARAQRREGRNFTLRDLPQKRLDLASARSQYYGL